MNHRRPEDNRRRPWLAIALVPVIITEFILWAIGKAPTHLMFGVLAAGFFSIAMDTGRWWRWRP